MGTLSTRWQHSAACRALTPRPQGQFCAKAALGAFETALPPGVLLLVGATAENRRRHHSAQGQPTDNLGRMGPSLVLGETNVYLESAEDTKEEVEPASSDAIQIQSLQESQNWYLANSRFRADRDIDAKNCQLSWLDGVFRRRTRWHIVALLIAQGAMTYSI